MFRVYTLAVIIFLSILLKISSSRINVPISKLATCREFVTDAKDCEHYFPVDFMKNYQSHKYNLYLKLYTFAYHDANIGLTSSKNKVDCRIVIGGWANTLSVLNCNGIDLDKSHIKNITSPMWPISIVVRQTTCGWLEVLLPGVAEPLLTANVTNLNLDYVCMYSYGKTSRWFYDCAEEEDKLYESQSNNCTLYSQHKRIDDKDSSTTKNIKCNELSNQHGGEIV